MGAATSPAEPERTDPASAENAPPGAGSPEASDDDATATGTADASSDATATAGGTADEGTGGEGSSATPSPDPAGSGGAPRRRSRRFPKFTRDTARPEGGGRAAPGDAPAPARQWPLLTVLGAAGVGLLIVGLDPFEEAFRVGAILIGAALITGAVLRWVVPSVGMLAVRSRFTDLVTYGLMGTLIVLLALVAQPQPWLDVPVLEDAVRFTIR
ncbi:DUF3017 domain-containing protein [Streptomyces sp. NPDC101181]|uniref:DUF3017 domain-containing protein n=1 Tax=Streptomyces sp. NPDC101181 TaxID=3366125 RepID=UPI00381DA446